MQKTIQNKSGNLKKFENLSILNPTDGFSTIDIEQVSELYEFMKKEKQLETVLDLSKIKVRPNDGRNYIYINRQQVIGSDRTDLINKLYDRYFQHTLDGLYPDWLRWRRDCDKVSNKTIKENMFLWNAFFKDTDIVKAQISKLTAKDFIKFFRNLLNHEPLTRKRFNDA